MHSIGKRIYHEGSFRVQDFLLIYPTILTETVCKEWFTEARVFVAHSSDLLQATQKTYVLVELNKEDTVQLPKCGYEPKIKLLTGAEVHDCYPLLHEKEERYKRIVEFYFPMRPWQSALVSDIQEKLLDKVLWFYDNGGSGKTKLARYLSRADPDKFYYINYTGNMMEFAAVIWSALDLGWSGSILLVDVLENKHEIYHAIRAIHDGMITSLRGTLHLDTHVIVFANFHPDLDKISSNKIRVYQL